MVVVLGPGRSGTSLVMQVLAACGLNLSRGDLVAANELNPAGFFEDAEIVAVQQALIQRIGGAWAMPVSQTWVGSEAAIEAAGQLRRIVGERLACGGPWGFKDPRTASLLPLWRGVFEGLGLAPRFVLAMRDPADVVASLRPLSERNDRLSEMLWLQRTLEALRHTGGDCYIVHYEDWFRAPSETASALAAFAGLDAGDDAAALVARVLQPGLNRARAREPGVVVRNRCVLDLHAALRTCVGQSGDRAALMHTVAELDATMDGFAQWSALATRGPREAAATQCATLARANAQLVASEQDLLATIAGLREKLRSLRERHRAFVTRTQTRPAGLWGRWLRRLAQSDAGRRR